MLMPWFVLCIAGVKLGEANLIESSQVMLRVESALYVAK